MRLEGDINPYCGSGQGSAPAVFGGFGSFGRLRYGIQTRILNNLTNKQDHYGILKLFLSFLNIDQPWSSE
jgi:hypothetical protein